uniref:Uncharacterized protein n=1 Tax=Setaria italica TaxID=4555 RepID=K3ZGS7_SETIT
MISEHAEVFVASIEALYGSACMSEATEELRKIWDQVLLAGKASADQVEALRQLRSKYIQGGCQDNAFSSS